MAHFILLDNWLRDVGGHNYQYAVDILQAAEVAGWKPVLVTHQDFQPTASNLPGSWLVKPRFRFGWEPRHNASLDGGSRHAIDLDGSRLPSLDQSFRGRCLETLANTCDIWRSDRQRRIDDYSEVCKELFSELGYVSGSRVFAPTVSDFDFIALASFLQRQPRSQRLDWHLQFHFDIAEGRKPNQESQHRRMRLLRRQFKNALAQLPLHRVHFYATTEQIASQYNALRTEAIQSLPYPVSNDLVAAAGSLRQAEQASRATRTGELPERPDRPLRITFAGVVRREKGKHLLKELTRRISESSIKNQIQLWLQGSADSLARVLPSELRNSIVFSSTADQPKAPVVAAKYPLDRTAYGELIRRAGVGVFPYDASRYHARCSGILVEMLAAGVPVIVPAGCWLSDQISEPIYHHLDRLSATAEVISRTRSDELHWSSQGSRNLKGKTEIPIAGGTDVELQTDAVRGANELLFSFLWGRRELGDYLRVELEQFGEDKQSLGRPWTEILAPRKKSLPSLAKFRLHEQATRLRLRCSNAYDSNPLSIRHAELRFLNSDLAHSPSGAVGLVAGDWRQIPELLEEIVVRHEHYRNSAVAFSLEWNEQHAAMRTIEAIEENSQPLRAHVLCGAA